jgi:tetratricopeptide (TPR) repeat protein
MLAILYYNRGFTYQSSADFDHALADYDEALKINPQFPSDIFIHRGEAYLAKGDRERMIKEFDQWLKLAGDRAAALHTRGETYTRLGLYDLALTDLNESLRLQPKDAPTFDGRGRNYLFMKEYRKAIADFDSALRLASHFYNSRYARGWAKLQIGDIAGGNKDIADAKRANAKVEEKYARYYGISR